MPSGHLRVRRSIRASCRDDDPDGLFVRGAEQRRAKLVCLSCPVRTECLAEALDRRIEFGVWGGKNSDRSTSCGHGTPERGVIGWLAGLPGWAVAIGLVTSLLTALAATTVRLVRSIWPQDSADRAELLRFWIRRREAATRDLSSNEKLPGS